jgi:hypothetical protein
VKTFNMDEYVNLPRDHPESYHHYMFNNFFKVPFGRPLTLHRGPFLTSPLGANFDPPRSEVVSQG